MFYKTYGIDQKDFIDKIKQDCKLVDILKDNRLSYAVRFEVPEVITFLFDHLDDLINISIDDAEQSNAARGILFELCDQFSLNISESSVFHNKMNSILGHDPISKTSIIVFSRVILSLGKSENYNIVSNLSENQFFFPKFCQLIENNSVYETLISLASDDHQSISAFFEDLNASSVLFKLLEKSPPSSQAKYFQVISEIITNTDKESTLIASLADDEHASKIYDYATKSDNSKVRQGAFTLLKALCNKKQQANNSYSSNENEEEEVENVIFNNATMDFLVGHFNDLCNYIAKLTTFDASTSQAVDLLILIIKSKKVSESEPPVFEAINGLLNQFFSNPIETKLHSSCLSLLFTISTSPNAVKQTDLKNRILKAWTTTKHDNRSSFWGFIFKFAEVVLDLGDGDSDDENKEEKGEEEGKSDEGSDWDKFIQDYTLYKQIINNSYGGELPTDSFENLDDIDGEVHIEDILGKNDDFIDDEIRVIGNEEEEEDDDAANSADKDDFKDDLNQLELDLKNDEDLENFVISKPKNSPNSPWAKDILDDLNDDFFIPKKEKTAKDVDWANQILQELQGDDLSGDRTNSFENFDYDDDENDNKSDKDENENENDEKGNKNDEKDNKDDEKDNKDDENDNENDEKDNENDEKDNENDCNNNSVEIDKDKENVSNIDDDSVNN